MKTIITEMPYDYPYSQSSLEIGYPWLTPGSIIMLEQILEPTFNVLEIGAGGSTIFFSHLCNSVKSFEVNIEWIDKIKQLLTENSNVMLVLHSMDSTRFQVKKEPKNYYDIVLVDPGIPESYRWYLVQNASLCVKVGGYLILDNYAKHCYSRFTYEGYEVYTFDDFHWRGKGTRICKKLK
jgi:hypothetical protein